MNIKVTCVTAVFNAVAAGNRDRLIRCVQSVGALKTAHEHLVYDGASNDGTAELLFELEKEIPGLKVFSEKDTGLYNALNKGVRAARGEWFYVLGCDDFVVSETFDEVAAAVPDEVEVVAGKVKMDRNGTLIDEWYRRRRILIGMPYGHQGMLARTVCVRDVGGFDERYRLAADYDMVLKFHLQGRKVRFVNKTIAVFSLGGMSTGCGSEGVHAEGPVVAELLRLPAYEAEKLLYHYVIPLRWVLKLLLHKDPTLRMGAVYMLVRLSIYLGRKVLRFFAAVAK